MKSSLFILITACLFVTSCKSIDDTIDDKDANDKDTIAVTSLDIPVVKAGWDIYTAGTYHYGPSIIINDDKSIDAWFATAGDAFGERLYPETSSASAVQLSGTMTAAQMFTATDPYYAIEVCCPTWGSTNADLTLSLYNWDTDYNTTTSKMPIATKTYNKVADNSWLKISNDNLFPAGKYLWVLSQPANTIGVWSYADTQSGTQGYLNGSSFSGSYRALLLPVNGVASYWDQIAYRHSADGGKTCQVIRWF